MDGYDKILGKNALREALNANRNINKILISIDTYDHIVSKLMNTAKEKGITIVKTDKRKLDNLTMNANHQGILAYASPIEYKSIDDILEYAKSLDEKPFIIILDNITDPHNTGAIIRSAYLAGAHGVVFAKRRSASIAEGTFKSSSGAIEHIMLCEVSNINQTIDYLKKQFVFVVGCDIDGDIYHTVDYDMSLAIVVGSEGSGISTLTKQKCDIIASIPIKQSSIDSLNASVAAGIILFEAKKSRG